MSIKWDWLKALLRTVLKVLIGILSPEIKELLTTALQNLYKKALETPNPWDDMGVEFLLDILSIPKPPVTEG